MVSGKQDFLCTCNICKISHNFIPIGFSWFFELYFKRHFIFFSIFLIFIWKIFLLNTRKTSNFRRRRQILLLKVDGFEVYWKFFLIRQTFSPSLVKCQCINWESKENKVARISGISPQCSGYWRRWNITNWSLKVGTTYL